MQATIECEFTLKCVCDMIRTYTQLHRTGNYPEHNSIIWSVWPNGWVFLDKLSRFGFESSCSHLNVRSRTCFEHGVPRHAGNYRVWIHSEMRMWHDRNIQWKRQRFWQNLSKSYFFFPICDLWSGTGELDILVGTISNRRGKFKLLGLQEGLPPVPFLSGTFWSPHKENPDDGG